MPRPFVASAVPSAAPRPASACPEAPPPWSLRGQAIVLPLLRIESGRLLIGAQAWVRYDESPVGPYDEYAVALLGWTGGKWGPRVVEMPVTSSDSMRCGRANWGYPKSVRALKYLRRGLGVRFEDEGRVRLFRLSRGRLPLAAQAWTVQVLAGQSVRVPMSVRGRARLCWSRQRLGVCIEDFQFHVQAPC